MTKHVALYCRLSPRPDGTYEGVPIQARAGRAYAARTWPGLPVVVYADKGISAANGDDRPGFESFRAALARGEVVHVWCVEQSRIERREVGWFALAAELAEAGIDELHTNRDGIVRVRDEVAGIKAVLAASEVRKLTRRVNDRLDANAAAGLPAGGRPYGYRHAVVDGLKTMVIVEAEADIIRECADRVLAGWALANIARDLVARGLTGPYQVKVKDKAGNVVTVDGTPVEDGGIPVTKPGTITYKAVQSWVTNPSVAGKRVHRGEIVGDGNWPAILDEATWRSVRARLAAPRVVRTRAGEQHVLRTTTRAPGRRYLLTGGIAVCGVCGAPLAGTAKPIRGRDESTAYYTCHASTGGRMCTGTVAGHLDTYVVGQLLDELDKPAFLEALAVDEHAVHRDAILTALAGLDGQRADLAKMWAKREVTVDEWRTARAELGAEEKRLRAELAAVPPPVLHVDVGAIRAAWHATTADGQPVMTLDERREIVSMFIESVTLNRAARRGAGFSPDRVAIVWRAAG